MITEINYEQEVKKVYEKAFLRKCNTGKDCWINDGNGIVISGFDTFYNQNKAWESAYNELVKSGKIKPARPAD